MEQHFCDKGLIIDEMARQIAKLFERGRTCEERISEVETVFFGAERNGDGFIRRHERLHEEDKMELKEVLLLLKKGQETQQEQNTELTHKVDKLGVRGRGFKAFWRDFGPVLTGLAALGAVLFAALK